MVSNDELWTAISPGYFLKALYHIFRFVSVQNVKTHILANQAAGSENCNRIAWFAPVLCVIQYKDFGEEVDSNPIIEGKFPLKVDYLKLGNHRSI